MLLPVDYIEMIVLSIAGGPVRDWSSVLRVHPTQRRGHTDIPGLTASILQSAYHGQAQPSVRRSIEQSSPVSTLFRYMLECVFLETY